MPARITTMTRMRMRVTTLPPIFRRMRPGTRTPTPTARPIPIPICTCTPMRMALRTRVRTAMTAIRTTAGRDGARLVSVERDLLARNNAVAEENRRRFQAARTLVLNLVSSPGSGKTALLVETLRRIGEKHPVAVIVGDQETTADADRIRATGAPAIQINTGKGCHLDADLVRGAMTRLGAPPNGILFIENVGNLVCPAGFDLGEAHKVVIVSVTEGEDKPLKYSGMFAAADLMVVTKTDLLPHLDFDVGRLIDNARRVHPGIAVLKVSAKTGDGMDRWLQWLEAARTLRLAAD